MLGGTEFEALLALLGEFLELLFLRRELGLVGLRGAFLVLVLGHGLTVPPFSVLGSREIPDKSLIRATWVYVQTSRNNVDGIYRCVDSSGTVVCTKAKLR
jgi:hypothetical protein